MVIVKLALDIENAAARAATGPQIESALAAGKRVWGYYWQYATASPEGSVQNALDVARRHGLDPLPWLFPDWEPYTDGSCPTIRQVLSAIREAQRLAQRVAMYTGRWVWNQYGHGSTALGDSGAGLWDADYSGGQTLDGFVPYGGWATRAGRQFTSQGVDQSVFREEVTR